MKCKDVQTSEIVKEKSDAIILGELQEIKKIVYDTTHHGNKEYFDGKFKVVSSWKLIDKQFVWINLPGEKTPCTKFEEGNTYLIYANQLGNELFIPIDSRTSKDDSTLASSHLKKLGMSKITISKGEFSIHRSPFYDISISVFIILVCAFLIYRRIIK